jgi:hypothetical protein
MILVFTQAYAEVISSEERESREGGSREHVLKFVAASCATPKDEPPLPICFVDSLTWQTASDTGLELERMAAFLCAPTALPTNEVHSVYPGLWQVSKEVRTDVLLDETIENGVRTRPYADQERQK